MRSSKACLEILAKIFGYFFLNIEKLFITLLGSDNSLLARRVIN